MTGKKCEPGCTCAKHTRSGRPGGAKVKCQPGCTCKRHSRKSVIDWNDPEARRAYTRQKAKEKYAANPEPAKEAARRHAAKMREQDPDYWRKYKRSIDSDLKYRHGITWNQWREILDEQDSRCYLCTELLDPDASRGVHVDHDHDCCPGERSCGKCIRGLSCHRCNTGIGAFGDDPDLMLRVAVNLEAANRRLRNAREEGLTA